VTRHISEVSLLGMTNVAEAQGEDDGWMWPELMRSVNCLSISSVSVGANRYVGALGNADLGMR
jgi:hypothetical protein